MKKIIGLTLTILALLCVQFILLRSFQHGLAEQDHHYGVNGKHTWNKPCQVPTCLKQNIGQ